MSLRGFHMLFLLFAIMGADLFGGWAIHEYVNSGGAIHLVLGIGCLLGGLGLALYALQIVLKLDAAHIV